MKRRIYDLCIIGAGAAGLTAAAGASGLGLKTALIDKSRFGGDCLWYGCVPTKAFLVTARLINSIKRARDLGIAKASFDLSWDDVKARVRSVIEVIRHHDSPERFESLGVDSFEGVGGRFISPREFETPDGIFEARRFVVSTGSRPNTPPIPGLSEAGFITNETILSLDPLPKRLIVIGGGPIGLEFASIFSAVGSRVVVLEMMDRLLPFASERISKAVEEHLSGEGIEFKKGVKVVSVSSREGGKTVTIESGGLEENLNADEIFVAAGRSPNIEDLGLDEAGVEVTRRAIKVDASLRTTSKRILAAGDVTGLAPFTHMAEYQAGIVVRNLVTPLFKSKVDRRNVPWCIYLEPEVAHAGITGPAAEKAGARKYEFNLAEFDRSIIESRPEGFIDLYLTKKGRIIGADIVADWAGDIIHEFQLAVTNGLSVSHISRTIHIYPTASQSARRAANLYYSEKIFGGFLPRIAPYLARLA